MPISAVAGRADLMRGFEEVFFSGTFGGEALSLAAARASSTCSTSSPVHGTPVATRDAAAGGGRQGLQSPRHDLEEVGDLLGGAAPWTLVPRARAGSHERDVLPSQEAFLQQELLKRGILYNGSRLVLAGPTQRRRLAQTRSRPATPPSACSRPPLPDNSLWSSSSKALPVSAGLPRRSCDTVMRTLPPSSRSAAARWAAARPPT